MDLLIKLTLVGIVFFGVLNLAGLHTWIERKQSAIIQDRIGANRASIYGFRLMGLFHPLADADQDVYEGRHHSCRCRQGPPYARALLLRLLRACGVCGNPVRRSPRAGRSRHRASGRQDRRCAALHFCDAVAGGIRSDPRRVCVAQQLRDARRACGRRRR